MAEGRIAQPRVYVRSKSKMAADLERQYVQRQEMDPRGSKVGTFALLDGKGNPGFGRNKIKCWDSCEEQRTRKVANMFLSHAWRSEGPHGSLRDGCCAARPVAPRLAAPTALLDDNDTLAVAAASDANAMDLLTAHHLPHGVGGSVSKAVAAVATKLGSVESGCSLVSV